MLKGCDQRIAFGRTDVVNGFGKRMNGWVQRIAFGRTDEQIETDE